MNDRIAGSFLILAFAMLWIPLGQHEFLTKHWMKMGTFMAPFLLFVCMVFVRQEKPYTDPRFLSLILLIAYVIHQFEEHWIDLFGRRYAFHPYLNEFLSGLTGSESGTEFMTPAAIFVINTSLVWLVAALGIWRGCDNIFATLCMAAIVVVNAFSHIGAGLSGSTYNPGLLTGTVLFVPLGIGVYLWLLRTNLTSIRQVLASLLWALAAHVIMIGGILAIRYFAWLPEITYFVALVFWSTVPSLAISNYNQRSLPRSNPGH